jgi:biopolymer transport protein ExbB/TolQ
MLYPYIVEGGLVWMMPIVLLSVCALAFCLERAFYWMQYFWNSRHRQHLIDKIFQMPLNLTHAAQYCKASKDVVILSLQEFLLQYQEVNLEIAARKSRLFAEARAEESRHFLDILALIASISGTLGLMGTVVGISLSFKSMAQGDSKGIALSLATALYTTVGGIILFLLSYLCLFFFQKFSDNLENILDVQLHKLNDLLEAREKSKIIFTDSPPIPVTEEKEAKFYPLAPRMPNIFDDWRPSEKQGTENRDNKTSSVTPSSSPVSVLNPSKEEQEFDEDEDEDDEG